MKFEEFWSCYKEVLLDLSEVLLQAISVGLVLTGIAGLVWIWFSWPWYIDVTIYFLLFTALAAHKKMEDKKEKTNEVKTQEKIFGRKIEVPFDDI